MAGAGCNGDGRKIMGRDLRSQDSRLRSRLEVACEPNCGVAAKSKLIDHPVPLAINVSKVYWVVSSRSILIWTLQVWARAVKVKGGLHQGSEMVVKGGEEKPSQIL